ncbi:MAG TPA: energy transducer TonB [Blastocatellia bacterium]|nr:energy transducer TonB [Blastocatellia bacterium]
MQAIALALASTLILTQAPAVQKKSDRERARLVGNVRSVRLERASLRDEGGKLVEGKRSVTVTRYDEKGYITELLYISDGEIAGRDVYTYDQDGNFTKTMYTTGRPHALIPQPIDTSRPKVFKVKVKHDPEGNLIEEATYDGKGKLLGIEQRKYDQQNNKVEVIQKAPDGTVKSNCARTYGEREQQIEMVCQYLNSPSTEYGYQIEYKYKSLSTEYKYKHEFDSTGNWTKRHETYTQIEDGKRTRSNKHVSYRTISYDAAKDVYPGEGSKGVAPLTNRPMVIRFSGGGLQEKATKRVAPIFPSEAGVSGSVTVEVRVDVNGKVIKAEVLSGPDELRQAAIDAARQWEFTPMKVSGQAIDMIGTITFNITR